MNYILDGYNLLFRRSPSDGKLDKKRDRFIEQLDHRAAACQLTLTIVFDGHFRPGERTRSHYHHLEILYSAFGETADDLILSELATYPKPHLVTVVTSDRELIRKAKNLRGKTETVPEFLKWLEERYQKRQIEPAPKKSTISPVIIEPSPVVQEDNLLDYYLKIFEKRYSEEKKPEEKPLSDYMRWLQTFEERMHDE